MNAAPRKVLRKVLMGFLIMEPDMRRGRIRRRRCLGTKRISGRSRLMLGCHAQTNQKREREREREREAEENQTISISIG